MKIISRFAFPLILFGLTILVYYVMTGFASDSSEEMSPLQVIKMRIHDMPVIVIAGGVSLVAGALIWSTSGKRPL